MRCPHCNSKLKKNTKFCPECGMTVIWEENSQANSGKAGKGKLSIIVIAILVIIGVMAFLSLKGADRLKGIKGESVPETTVSQLAFSDDPTAISAASQSVVKLNCYDKNGDLYATGSGCACFADNVIVTNYHVIEGGVYSIEASTEDGNTFDITYVLAIDEAKDIAILGTSAPHNLALLQPGNSDDLQKGEKVVAIGSPLGLLNSVSTGVFSGYVDENGMDVLQFTASISSGSSGGALFNNAGGVLGITFASYEAGQNLNLAIPISAVARVWENRNNSQKLTISTFYEQNIPTYSVEYVLSHYSELEGTSFYIEGWVSTSRYWKETNADVYHAWIYCYNNPESVLYPNGNDPLERVTEDYENSKNYQCICINYSNWNDEQHLKSIRPGQKIRVFCDGDIYDLIDRVDVDVLYIEIISQ